jgi:hypothetical protein
MAAFLIHLAVAESLEIWAVHFGKIVDSNKNVVIISHEFIFVES